MAHVSGNKKLITLINPQAVNLSEYKEKLEQAIKSYERYILHLKYSFLLDNATQQLGFIYTISFRFPSSEVKHSLADLFNRAKRSV